MVEGYRFSVILPFEHVAADQDISKAAGGFVDTNRPVLFQKRPETSLANKEPCTDDGLLEAAVARVGDGEGPTQQFLYETAPIGLAFLSHECRYLQIIQRLTEIAGS